MTAPRPLVRADQVLDVVDDVLDPTAPSTAAAPVDVAAVAPAVGTRVRRWVPVAIGGASGLAAVAVAVANPGWAGWRWDEALHSWALAVRGSADSSFARAVTWGGATSVALPALVVVGACARRGRVGLRTRLGAGIALGASAALGVWLGLLLNHQVDRARPPVADWWAAAGGPAFPSGHTAAATVVAGLGAWALAQRVSSRRARSAVWAGAAAYALLVGWSRYWLGVHWPSDVLGGWLLGAAWVALVVTVVSAVRRRSVPRSALEA